MPHFGNVFRPETSGRDRWWRVLGAEQGVRFVLLQGAVVACFVDCGIFEMGVETAVGFGDRVEVRAWVNVDPH